MCLLAEALSCPAGRVPAPLLRASPLASLLLDPNAARPHPDATFVVGITRDKEKEKESKPTFSASAAKGKERERERDKANGMSQAVVEGALQSLRLVGNMSA